jgi:thiopeptide-type bacteriocin biosynthesis protein
MRRLRDAYAAEFDRESNLPRQIGEKYRRERSRFSFLLEDRIAVPVELEAAWGRLGERSARLAPLAGKLADARDRGLLLRPFEEIVASHVHMHLNRVLRSEPRAQERVLYDFAARVLAARVARRQA